MKRDIYYYDHYEKVKDINETLLDNCIELFEFLIKVEDEDFIEEHIIENEDGSKGIKFKDDKELGKYSKSRYNKSDFYKIKVKTQEDLDSVFELLKKIVG